MAVGNQPVTHFESNKVRALLAYLSVEARRPHPRDVLAGLLWPDRPEQAAHTNLRHALASLRHAIGDQQATPPFLLIARGTIQFNTSSDYSLDVEGLTRQTTDEFSLRTASILDLETALGAFRGEFLEGLSSDSAAFEEWILLMRERINHLAQKAIYRLTVCHEQRGDYERAATCVRQQLEFAPWDELAHQNLMRLLAHAGMRSLALAQYQACRRSLMQELGVEPSRETEALYVGIRDGTTGAPPGSPAPPSLPAFLRKGQTEGSAAPIFVARERELARLQEALDQTLKGQGQVLFVTGEPGSGKSALVQEFGRRAMSARADLIVAQGNGNAHSGVGDPCSPFTEILQMLAGDVETRWAGGAITRAHAIRLWGLLPGVAQALAHEGPDVVDRFVPGAALLARARAFTCGEEVAWVARLDELIRRKAMAPHTPAGLQQSALFEQYTCVLRAVAQQTPLIVLLDDLQWVDPSSASLLFHLGRKLAGARILVIGAFRPGDVTIGDRVERHPLEAVVNEFRRTSGDAFIDLSHAQGRPFVDALLDTEPNCLGGAFRETLYQRSGGHPLFTVELLRGLQERGDLTRDAAGQWVEGPRPDWDRLPARVEAVIAERIGRLPPCWQALLTTASVEGLEFTAEVVARVNQVDAGMVIRDLSGGLSRHHQLVAAIGCQRLGDRWLSRYRFRHALYQTYLYNRLDSVERAHLHQSIGQALETL